MEKIGYIGLGIMGKPMVENLTRAGHGVNVFARRKASIDALGTECIQEFSTPAELAEASTLIISCVSETSDSCLLYTSDADDDFAVVYISVVAVSLKKFFF